MKTNSNQVYILTSSRIPFAKSQTSYANVTRKDLMVAALHGLVAKGGLKGKLVGDTALGAVMNGAGDFNLARECLLSTEVPRRLSRIQCATRLRNWSGRLTWQIALKIHTGAISYGIAGGVDTNSDIPIEVSEAMRKFLFQLERAKNSYSALEGF